MTTGLQFCLVACDHCGAESGMNEGHEDQYAGSQGENWFGGLGYLLVAASRSSTAHVSTFTLDTSTL
jgi:hypothetical protein